MDENEVIETDIEETPPLTQEPARVVNNNEELFKRLGVKNEKELAKKLKQGDELKKSQLTETENMKLSLQEQEELLTRTQMENHELNTKLNVVVAGVSKEYVDDVCLLVSSRIDESNTFDDVLAKLKETSPFYFGEKAPIQNGGTGTRIVGSNKPASKKTALDQSCIAMEQRLKAKKQVVRKSIFDK